MHYNRVMRNLDDAVQVRLDSDLRARLDRLSERSQMPNSELIRRAIAECVNQWERTGVLNVLKSADYKPMCLNETAQTPSVSQRARAIAEDAKAAIGRAKESVLTDAEAQSRDRKSVV